MKDNQTTGKVVLYQAEDGGIQLIAKLEEESIWLSMSQIAELFHVNVPAISKHIKNIYTAKELVLPQLFPKWQRFERRECGGLSVRWISIISI